MGNSNSNSNTEGKRVAAAPLSGVLALPWASWNLPHRDLTTAFERPRVVNLVATHSHTYFCVFTGSHSMFLQQLAQAEIAEHRQLALSLATKDVDRDSHGRPLKYPHAHQCPPKPIPAALFEAGVINRDFIKLPKHKRDEVKRDSCRVSASSNPRPGTPRPSAFTPPHLIMNACQTPAFHSPAEDSPQYSPTPASSPQYSPRLGSSPQ